MAGAHLRDEDRRALRLPWLVAGAALLVGLVIGVVVTGGGSDDGGAAADVVADGGDLAARAVLDPDPARAGVAVARPDPGPITLAFVGDINAERSLRTRLEQDPAGFVGPFADLLRGADLVVGNLEAAVTAGGTAIDKEFTFRAPPSILDALAAGGIDVVSVANNHGLDFGASGLEETLAIKRSRADGMLIGVGADEDEAFAPYVAEVRGHTVAVIAATQVIDGDLITQWTAGTATAGLASAKRVDRLVAEVRATRERADTVVVFVHWGTETEVCPNSLQQELATTLVEAGADIVVGGHAHRVQSGGRLGQAFVGYGLGNFLFGAVSTESAKTGVLLVTVDGRSIEGYEWRPGRIVDRVPMPLAGDDAAAAVDEWNSLRSCTNLSG